MTNAELKQIAIDLVGEQELTRRFKTWITGLIKKEQLKRSESAPDEFFLNQATAILNDLNTRAKRRFTLTPEVSKMIKVLLARGYQLPDFYRVHEIKAIKWLGDEKMEYSLRPSTLYRTSHFDEYLAEWDAMEQRRQELEEKRLASEKAVHETRQNQPTPVSASSASSEKRDLIAKLLAKKWWEFDSWREFMRWTLQFPDAESLARYEMPAQIKRMRTAPNMVMRVLKNENLAGVEEQYQILKKDKHNG